MLQAKLVLLLIFLPALALADMRITFPDIGGDNISNDSLVFRVIDELQSE